MQATADPNTSPREPDWDELLAPAGTAGVAPSRLGEAVVVRLTEAILDGRLQPGDPLPSEARIAAAFGVSKPIAREALRDLAAMGVVQVAQGKVSRVRALDAAPLARFFRFAVGSTARGMRDAVELRRMLEPQVAWHAAQRRSAEDVEAFRSICARMEAAIGRAPEWIEADLAFHARLASATQNRLVVLQMQGLEPVVRELMGRLNERATRTTADWRRTLQRHTAVADAVIAGDPPLALQAMQAHFEAADDAIDQIFDAAANAPGTPHPQETRP